MPSVAFEFWPVKCIFVAADDYAQWNGRLHGALVLDDPGSKLISHGYACPATGHDGMAAAVLRVSWAPLISNPSYALHHASITYVLGIMLTSMGDPPRPRHTAAQIVLSCLVAVCATETHSTMQIRKEHDWEHI
ncbi:uncharacterized protein SETTUDRAFT_32337 [Exserohilum turcica Et28A]|uniref:Uncharacterized protein n=1 Tax=Exserohilum turcicum (strain 28A) TaxID=671987 RepID=R0K6H0_EXST2|nr:uncharacterized protein SETTUDRAFT_32337 [Exserohilum turcica Et28A]EOA85109.1 hypothetical protein SETTUDRAFT_32337 [Exserohilum turcica Et28A]